MATISAGFADRD